MGILKRRVKSVPSTSHPLMSKMGSYQNILGSKWQTFSPRDQLALLLLGLFLLLFLGGYGGYSVHQNAKNSKAAYQEQVSDYFWLRAQASNINTNMSTATNDANGGAEVSLPNKVTTLLSSSGIIDAQIVAAGDNGVQMSFSHASQAVVSAALGQLIQQGWQFTQLSMEQEASTKIIQVQATLTS